MRIGPRILASEPGILVQVPKLAYQDGARSCNTIDHQSSQTNVLLHLIFQASPSFGLESCCQCQCQRQSVSTDRWVTLGPQQDAHWYLRHGNLSGEMITAIEIAWDSDIDLSTSQSLILCLDREGVVMHLHGFQKRCLDRPVPVMMNLQDFYYKEGDLKSILYFSDLQERRMTEYSNIHLHHRDLDDLH